MNIKDAIRAVPSGREHRAARAVEVDEKSRTIQFVASDETCDRYGDVIKADGWDIAAFQTNPVLLWAHDSAQPPIGQVTSVERKGTQLLARAQFLPEGVYAFADTLWRIVCAGALRAVSVGFLPKVTQPIFDADDNLSGYLFVKQELLELSLTPIPANPSAIAIGKSLKLPAEVFDRVFCEKKFDRRNASVRALQFEEIDAMQRLIRLQGAGFF